MMQRIPSTPEQAVANVALEAEFHEACTALRVEHNERLNEQRQRRAQLKENARAHIQAINHAWAVERANIRAAIDRLKDERAHLRSQLHDGFSDDAETLRRLTEQIHEQRINLANTEMVWNERVKDARDAVNDAIAELGKETIALQADFHRRHSELRRELAAKVSANREKAYAALAQQEGGES